MPGVDDYLAMPFTFSELHSRLNALVRRHQPLAAETRLFAKGEEADTGRSQYRESGQCYRNPSHWMQANEDIVEKWSSSGLKSPLSLNEDVSQITRREAK